MTPLYPSCQDRGEESDTPFKKEITHEDLQRILQEHGLQEALQASADGANVSCNTCNKKLDFKAPKTWSPQYTGGNSVTNWRTHIKFCKKTNGIMQIKKKGNGKDELCLPRPNPLGFAYVHSNKHLQHTNTVTNASSPSAQKSKEVVTIPSTGSLLTHAHTASKGGRTRNE